MRRAAALIAATGLLAAGAAGASALLDQPQDARPVQDPVGDLLRDTNRTPLQNPGQAAPPPPIGAPVETAPAAAPAPNAPVVITAPPAEIAALPEVEDEPAETAAPAPRAVEEPATPGPRQRRRVAIVQAIDKTTAETMKFEVEVGGRPVRFKDALVFSARACEVSAPDERIEDSAAYLDVSVQARNAQEARQIFRGWMFASAPAVSGLQHPHYDAWVVGCKA
jgi:hypothetical protein